MNRVPWHALGLATLVLLACAGRGAAQAPKDEEIAEAIKKGVNYLKSIQNPDGTWPHNDIGATALAGWTLLECGVDPQDKSVQKAAEAFRKQALTTTFPYTIALGIFFLDRLGDEMDIPIIESLALRLIYGQNVYGGWGYVLPDASPEEKTFLTEYLQNAKPGKLNPKLPKDRKARTPNQLSPVHLKRLAAYPQLPLAQKVADPGDNSCTQFAMMALWVAKRYGITPERNLLFTEYRFRKIQYDTGGWGYNLGMSPYDPTSPDTGPSLAMSSAGLLALALGQASDPKRAKVDLTKDRQVIAAFSSVASSIGNPVGDRSKVPSLEKLGRMYYALWSLERMAVVYGLEKHKIGTKDWFGWGAELLIANQGFNGAWTGKYALGGCDTCFALLFLTRTNVAVDLTNKVKAKPIQVKENPRLMIPELPNIVSKEEAPKNKPKDSPKKNSSTAQKLSEQLVDAPPAKQDAVLEKFKDAYGASYTEALAGAIPKLKGAGKTKARAVLAERLALVPAASLTAHLKSEQWNCRAAALAAGTKKSKAHISELIHLLEDAGPPVAHAADPGARCKVSTARTSALKTTPPEPNAVPPPRPRNWQKSK